MTRMPGLDVENPPERQDAAVRAEHLGAGRSCGRTLPRRKGCAFPPCDMVRVALCTIAVAVALINPCHGASAPVQPAGVDTRHVPHGDTLGSADGENRIPVADAGPDRYAMRDPLVLDGTGSYDPDSSGVLKYAWSQVSGPPIRIAQKYTAHPTISGFNIATPLTYPKVVLQLEVNDGTSRGRPDRVRITVLPNRRLSGLKLENAPFDPNRPTIVFFGGGNGSSGGSTASGLTGEWARLANVIRFGRYSPGPSQSSEPDYLNCAEALIAFLSPLAPVYDEPIQLVGYSTGGRAAAAVGDLINTRCVFCRGDARYNINRVTLLDGYIPDPEPVRRFLSMPVNGEPSEVDNYTAELESHFAGGINVAFPAAGHHFPYEWFVRSIDPSTWPDGDVFNHGITAGAFCSVGGAGRNLRLLKNVDPYWFQWVDAGTDYLVQIDAVAYPGRLPGLVSLVGPRDGATVGPNGAVLSCLESENAVAYRLLFGSDPHRLNDVISDTSQPPRTRVRSFPYVVTYWAIEVRDRYGASIQTDPRHLHVKEPGGAPALESVRGLRPDSAIAQ